MTNLPPFNPLAGAGVPLSSTILVIEVPLVVGVALALAVLAAGLCLTLPRRRRGRRRTLAPGRIAGEVMPYAPGPAR
jgi:hypothetical protein